MNSPPDSVLKMHDMSTALYSSMKSTVFPSPPFGKNGWPWHPNNQHIHRSLDTSIAWPRICVVTPSFNQGNFIEETIRSVLLQGYPNLEYFIFDGGSTDDSLNVIRKYEPWLTYWTSEKDDGQAHAINKGFKRSTAEVFTWLNSDDVYCAGALHTVAGFFKQNPGLSLVCGDCAITDEMGNNLYFKKAESIRADHLLRGGSVPGQPAVFFHKDVIRKVGLLDEKLQYLLDWEFWLRISLSHQRLSMACVHQTLAMARIWKDAKTSVAGVRAVIERKSVLDRVFASEKLPEGLRRLRSIAYADLHWRTAFCYQKESGYQRATREILSAISVEPCCYNHLKRLRRFAFLAFNPS